MLDPFFSYDRAQFIKYQTDCMRLCMNAAACLTDRMTQGCRLEIVRFLGCRMYLQNGLFGLRHLDFPFCPASAFFYTYLRPLFFRHQDLQFL